VTIQDTYFSTGERILASTARSARRPGRQRIQVETARLGVADWQTLRELRLLALELSPRALFGSYADEAARRPEHWQRELTVGTWTVARRQGRAVALAGLVGVPPEERELSSGWPARRLETRCIVSVWVHPDVRGGGVMSQLLDAVEAEAVEQGVGALVLWTFDTNPLARQMYVGRGYALTSVFNRMTIRGIADCERKQMKRVG